MAKWGVLAVLAAAQFLMVLDQAVMNVAISQLVEDFDTTVTTIQAVIALYALVMAGLMLTGGKLGDIWGRRRAFTIGLCIYGVGSALTAASWSVPSLMFGWSILEGIGAALVMPALVALVASNYKGASGRSPTGCSAASPAPGIAVGPILGGWVTTELQLAGRLRRRGRRRDRHPARHAADPRAGARPGAPQLDWVGGVLSASGLALVVLGVLQASNWGWLQPRNSPIEPFGFSLTPFVIAAGALVLAASSPGSGGGRSRASSRWSTSGCSGSLAARRRLDAARPEPDPDGDLLHDPALSCRSSRASTRSRPACGCCPPRSGCSSPRSPARPWPRASPRGRWSGPGSAIVFVVHPDAARHDRAGAEQRLLPGRDGRARGRHGPDRLPARQRGPVLGRGHATAARPAACRTPPSSSAPRWAPRCSARS